MSAKRLPARKPPVRKPEGVFDVRKVKTAFGEGGRDQLTFVVAYNGSIAAGSERYEAIRQFADTLKAPANAERSIMLLPVAPREPTAQSGEGGDPEQTEQASAPKTTPKQAKAKSPARVRARAPAKSRAKPPARAKSQARPPARPARKSRSKTRPKARTKRRPKPVARTRIKSRAKSSAKTRTRKARR